MNQIIFCPACQRRVQLPDEYLGRAVQCPECGKSFVAGGATAVSATADAPRPSPAAEIDEPYQPSPRRRRYAADEDDDAFDDWGIRRRSRLRPDRGGMILAFGILGLMAPCYLGLIFGPLAWFMGTADLAAIDAGEMNPNNRGLIQAGRIIGAIGFFLYALILLATAAYFIFLFAMVGMHH